MASGTGTGDAGDNTIHLANIDIFTESPFEVLDKQKSKTDKINEIEEPVSPERHEKYPELEKLFKLYNTIGSGGFSKVKMASDLLTGNTIAIKIVDKEQVGSELPRIHLEIETLMPLTHPHICQLYNVISCPKNIFMIMEFCPTDLYEYIVKHDDKLPVEEARRIFIQLMSAVAYLHSNGIAHRDLKPENVLLDHKNNVKLTDFGLCAVPGKGKINRAILKTLCGSPSYCAPELLREPPYSGSKVDVWSLGVLLFVLMVGQLPFYSKTLKELYLKIKDGQYKTPEWVSEDAKDLIDRMLQPKPTLRPSLHRLWSHVWIQKGDLESFEQQITQSQMEINEEEAELSRIRNRLSAWRGVSNTTPSSSQTSDDNIILSMVVPYFETSSGDWNDNNVETSEKSEINVSTKTIQQELSSNSLVSSFRSILYWFLSAFRKNRNSCTTCVAEQNKVSVEEPRQNQDTAGFLSVDLKTLILPQKSGSRKAKRRRRQKNFGLTVVDEPFADCILDKLQFILQSMGIPSQRKGSTVKHGVASPCKFKFDIISLKEPCNFFCIRRQFLNSRDPKLVVQIMQKILLISQHQE